MSEHPFGYVADPRATEAFVASLPAPTLAQAGPNLRLDEKLDVFLGNYLLRLDPNWKRLNQPIGSCVGWGASHATDITAVCDVLLRGEPEAYGGRILEAATYGFSRVESRGGKPNYGQDGSYGAAAAEALTKYGTLHYQRDYGNGRLYTQPTADQERAWGRTGVPDDLQIVAARHKVTATTLITTFEEAARCIQNGYAVFTCSTVGWDMVLNNGWAQGSDYWPHCTAFSGVRWSPKPGLWDQNSWGNCYLGTFDEALPLQFRRSGCWLDEGRVNRMLRARDSFAIGGYIGFEPTKLSNWTGGVL